MRETMIRGYLHNCKLTMVSLNQFHQPGRMPPPSLINSALTPVFLQIYSEQFNSGFNDITSGGNQGCGTPGFAAVPGWDPVTGLGAQRHGWTELKN